MIKRWIYIIAYDSPDSKRRAKMLDRVEGFGMDPQLSFHECHLSRGETRELWNELLDCHNADEDRLLLLRLDPRNATWRLGKQEPHSRPANPIIYIG